MSQQSRRAPAKREKHPSKATTSQPQEEFIEIPNRPSVPERAARKGVRSRWGHLPPVEK